MDKKKDRIFQLSGVLILFSAIGYFFVPAVAPWIMAFAVGAFAAILASRPYPGKSLGGKRLFNFQVLGCVLMAVATYLMFRQRNEWILVMSAAAVFFLYASILLPKIFEEENKQK